MRLSRRQTLALGAAACAGIGAGPALSAQVQQAIDAFADGAAPVAGRVALDLPLVVEDGNATPLSVAVDSPMRDADHVVAVQILAEGNPNLVVATLRFGPLAGRAQFSTRIRLARSQAVIALAKMNDGAVYMDRRDVVVTVGGCGG